MGAGLSKTLVPVLAAGGIDTKTDPRAVQPGSLLEMENVWQLRPGELRFRNGFSALTATDKLGHGRTIDNLFVLQGSAYPASIATGSISAAAKNAQKYVAPKGWFPVDGGATTFSPQYPYPVGNVKISGVSGSFAYVPGATPADLVDGSAASLAATTISTQGTHFMAWLDNSASQINYIYRSRVDGTVIDYSSASFLGTMGSPRPPVCCASGSALGSRYITMFFVDTGTPATLKAMVISDSSTTPASVSTVASNAVSAAQPWIDAIPIVGGSLVQVAYRATGGGVSYLVFNPASGTVQSGPVNVAGADASMCLALLDDQNATGNAYLATAGSASGIVVRTISTGGQTVTSTQVMDATATAGVRQITGNTTVGGANYYLVLWEQSVSPTYNSYIRSSQNSGGVVTDPSFGLGPTLGVGLYSRTFMANDGLYYYIASYDSTVQPSYFVVGVPTQGGVYFELLAAQIFPTTAGGRRAFQSSLASAGSSLAGSPVIPLARKSSSSGIRIMTSAEVMMSSRFYRPRELSGTVFLPGGIIQRFDGRGIEHAIVPIFSESPSLASSFGGSMTAGGAYSYRLVLKRVDATGRATRSAGSVAVTGTVGGGDGSITITAGVPIGLNVTNVTYTVEVYRAGPAAAGATDYHLVAEVPPNANWGIPPTTTTFTYKDNASDATAQAGLLLYSTGNVLENFPPPASSLLEVNAGRVGIVNAEDPTEFWPSKEYKSGQGLGFNPALTIRVTGDGYGGITALAAMDGRWILFKSSAIYVISGDGPTDAGQGSFNSPQAVSLSVGTVLPGSVVSTPDGIMFQAAAGLYLLNRGLGLDYIGKAVEKYTLAENVVDASIVTGQTQVRFVMPSGRCLVYNYDQKNWSTFLLRTDGSAVVACANPASGWSYALANGIVMQETPGVYTDTLNGTSTGIVPRIGLPYLNLAQINGYQRIYSLVVLGEYVGDHLLQAAIEFDYSGKTDETYSKAIHAGPFEYEIRLARQKSHAMRLTLTCTIVAGSGGFRLSGVSALVGVKRGHKFPAGGRLTSV